MSLKGMMTLMNVARLSTRVIDPYRDRLQHECIYIPPVLTAASVSVSVLLDRLGGRPAHSLILTAVSTGDGAAGRKHRQESSHSRGHSQSQVRLFQKSVVG
ncbi:Hypothetical predicted protein [Pelobates cultripes]|uniref:Uncharacterized protein n=1 Tax=Pelobates cultripes TaxID=61616 RepID=A0AAD1R5L9_PELCU|nr:Hypothetical predicted protein [Pelobates cultripes]